MKQHFHIIYLPGLGDKYDPIRRACLWVWRLYGGRVTMVPMRWASDESYHDKLARVEEVMLGRADERIVVMGESAGGSVALTLYAWHLKSVTGLATLCGKNTRPDTVSPGIYARNPAFWDSMRAAEAAVSELPSAARRRFVSVVPWYDPTVPVVETLLPGCRKMTVPAIGHLFSILAMLTLYAPFIVHRVKNM